MQSPRFRLVVWYTSAAGQSSYDDDDDDDDDEWVGVAVLPLH